MPIAARSRNAARCSGFRIARRQPLAAAWLGGSRRAPFPGLMIPSLRPFHRSINASKSSGGAPAVAGFFFLLSGSCSNWFLLWFPGVTRGGFVLSLGSRGVKVYTLERWLPFSARLRSTRTSPASSNASTARNTDRRAAPQSRVMVLIDGKHCRFASAWPASMTYTDVAKCPTPAMVSTKRRSIQRNPVSGNGQGSDC